MLLAGPTILTHGNDEQRARYLRPILNGQEAWCQLFSEPGAGSDLASLQCRAERDGDEWIVNGQKVWTSGGQTADLGMLVARTDPDAPKHKGISYFAIEMDQPGVEVRPLREMTGRSLFSEVFFSDARVNQSALIGELNGGWAVANTTLANERAGLGSGGSGAVGGAMPIVRAVSDGLAGDRITRVVGILNGTTNAVLSRMDSSGCSLEDALADARARGYAEADLSADLDGDDARAKLAILCAMAFGLRVEPKAIPARSAAGVTVADFARARRADRTIRQLAHAEYNRATSTLTAWVAPVAVARDSIFGRTMGAQNAALITGVYAGDVGVFGAGAGGDATAVAILSDLAAIARDRAAIVPPPRLSSDFNLQTSHFELQTSNFKLQTSLAEAV